MVGVVVHGPGRKLKGRPFTGSDIPRKGNILTPERMLSIKAPEATVSGGEELAEAFLLITISA